MIGDAAAQKFREPFAGERFLRGGERKRIANRHRGSDRLRQFLAGFAARREDEHGREFGAQGAAEHARPETFRLDESGIGEIAQIHFFEWDGAFRVRNQHGVAADALQPGDDVLRIARRCR